MIHSLKPIPKHQSRLGLERQPENYQRMPGTKCNWVPSRVGNNYLTGLEDNEELRKELESKTGYDLSPTSDFYATLSVKIEEQANGFKFDDSKPLEKVIILAMKKSHAIAASLSEWTSGKKFEAEWYFENAEFDAKVEQEAISAKTKAFTLYANISDAKKKAVSKILGIPVYGLSAVVIQNRLFQYLDDPKKGKDNCIEFVKVLELDPDTIELKEIVEDSIQYNVIRKNSALDYVYGDSFLGIDKDSIFVKIKSDDDLRLSLMNKIDIAKNAAG